METKFRLIKGVDRKGVPTWKIQRQVFWFFWITFAEEHIEDYTPIQITEKFISLVKLYFDRHNIKIKGLKINGK